MTKHPPDPPRSPLLRVVRGDATREELAVLVAVLSARAAARARTSPTTPQPMSAWRDHRRLTREALPHGPGTWRASAWPR
jgi:Acyl-CoA carboxylase epsilon subunit